MTFSADTDQPRILFHHLPKTAGTTLINLLDQRFTVTEILPKGFFGVPARDVRPDHVESNKDQLRGFGLLHGHFPASVFDDGFDDFFRFTVLREPVRRLWSLYRDWLTKSEESLRGAHPDDIRTVEKARQLTLDEFLGQSEHPIPALFDNGQVRMLAGAMDVERVDESHLERAIETLNKMDLVGVTECFEGFLSLLCARLGWELADQVPALNVRSAKDPLESLPEVDFWALKNRCSFDRKLYDYAVKRFDQAIAKWIQRQSGQRPADPRLRLRRPPPSESVRLTMDQGFEGSGWHVREGVGTGSVWRWTGPGCLSTVWLGLVPSLDYTLTVDIVSVIHQEIVDGLNLYFNGIPVGWDHYGVERGAQVIRGKLEAPIIQSEVNVLSLEVPYTASQVEVEPESDDNRQKGVAITAIHVSAQEDSH